MILTDGTERCDVCIEYAKTFTLSFRGKLTDMPTYVEPGIHQLSGSIPRASLH